MPAQAEAKTVFLCGDVMTGRGIDQALPFPGDPRLYEPALASAAEYLGLAEAANGPVPRPVAFDYVWGSALAELDRRRPEVRLVNLETAVTTSLDPWPKGINYRMNPRNAPVLTAAGVNVCGLANNHVLDWGERGLLETIETLDAVGVGHVGAGRNLSEASAPARLPIAGGRVLVFAWGLPSSGIPDAWAATGTRAGVNFLPDLSAASVRKAARAIAAWKRPGDIAIASIHWGANWGFRISTAERSFAHAMIDDAGVDVLHGHSSHHVKAIEVHSGKLVLYGCGDFIDDYEGIAGYEGFRGDLALMYFPAVEAGSGTLRQMTMVPARMRRFRLGAVSPDEAIWLRDTLTREGQPFGTRAELASDMTLSLEFDARS